MRTIKIALQLVRNYFFMPGASGRCPNPFRLDTLVFLLNLFPPYNYLCVALVRAGVAYAKRMPRLVRFYQSLARRGFLYGALRHLPPEEKNSFDALVLAKMRPKAVIAASSDVRRRSAEIEEIGYADLGRLVSPDGINSVHEYFGRQSGYNSQMPLMSDGVLRPFDVQMLGRGSSERYFCFSQEVSLNCGEIAKLVRSSEINALAEAYLGYKPVLYNVNTFATLRGDADHYVFRLHRDYDDFRFLAFFIYWTDVSSVDGATIYFPGTHRKSGLREETKAFLTGEAGKVFALDTFGLHSGNRSVANLRLATWFRFGTAPNLATIQNRQPASEL